MMNNIPNRPTAFDIEAGAIQEATEGFKKAMVSTCATLAAGCATAGGLLFMGGAGRVGPLAVQHDYSTLCSRSMITGQSFGCDQVDNSSGKATTFGVMGAALLGASAALTYAAIKLARS